METKTCTKCGVEKPLSEFSPKKTRCKPCRSEDSKKYYQEHPEQIAIYWAKYYDGHKEEVAEYNKWYRETHKEEIQQNRDEHKEDKKVYNRWYDRNISCYDQLTPEQKIPKLLRTRLLHALAGEFKNGSAVADLGCTIPELKIHLESKFQPGMTWDNYGLGPDRWHIDHVFPMSAFNLVDRQHLILVCHYLNLQPLWAKDNFSKNDKYPTFPWMQDAA